jgi:hypothetical protein
MFKLNTARTYKYPVTLTVYDESGTEHEGKFHALFKVLPNSVLRNPSPDVADRPLLDLVLVGAEGIAVDGPDGLPLTGEALCAALKDDPAAAAALVTAYSESITKKTLRRN